MSIVYFMLYYLYIFFDYQKGSNMKLILSSTNNIPIYEQIKIQIKDAISQGDLVENSVQKSQKKTFT